VKNSRKGIPLSVAARFVLGKEAAVADCSRADEGGNHNGLPILPDESAAERNRRRFRNSITYIIAARTDGAKGEF